MRVVMTVQITGTRNGIDWPPPGESIDVSAAEADDLIRAGLAGPAPGRPTPPNVETTTLPAVERAVARRVRPVAARRGSGTPGIGGAPS